MRTSTTDYLNDILQRRYGEAKCLEVDMNFKGRKKLDRDQIWIYRPYNHRRFLYKKGPGETSKVNDIRTF